MLFLFFLSGCAGLIYEVVWSRMLGTVFGTSALAISTVLIVFMGGMSLGSYVLGKITDRLVSPFLFYGILEGAIGILCLFIPFLLPHISEIYRHFYPSIQNSYLTLAFLRLALVILILLPPTFLMGGTFPAFTSAYSKRGEEGKDISIAYAINTGGAVVGTILAGFVFLPSLGIFKTVKLSASLNFLVFLSALFLNRTIERVKEESVPLPVIYSQETAKLAMLVIGISGFSAMALEVSWTRALHMVFGITTYAFTTMLASFLLGIVVGSSLLGKYIERVRSLPLLLAYVEMGAGFTALLFSRIIDFLPVVFLWLFKYIGNSFHLFYLTQFIICSLVLLIPTSLFGASFPLATRIALRSREQFAGGVGRVYAFNTLGNILGSFFAGFILMRMVGAAGIIVIASFLNIFAGGIMLKGVKEVPAVRLKEAWGIFGAVLFFGVMPFRWNIQRLTSGVYLYAPYYLKEGSIRSAIEMMDGRKIIFYKDSITSTITVTEGRYEGKLVRALQMDGKTEASSFADLTTQYMIAHLPLLLHRNPRSAMVIGLASGCTLGAALRHPLQKVVCAEIEPAMVEASRFFSDVNYEYWKDKRARIIIEDGRNYLYLTKEKYDCIISEPSNPWISGLGNLFTKEFYETVKKHLNKGGIFALWIPAYITSLSDFKGMIATVSSVFPSVSLWNYPPIYADVLVICGNEPLRVFPERIEEKIKDNAQVYESLGRIGFNNAQDIIKGFLLADKAVEEFSNGYPLNTDDLPLIEYSAPKWLYRSINYEVLDELYRLARVYRSKMSELKIIGGE
ncbi:MAG: fused MFS/spermidine synthase [bacterium]